jgi:hypothetical protein
MLRSHYSTLLTAALTSTSTSLSSLVTLAQKQSRTNHLAHCYDFLRQAILCAGDMTLEGKAKVKPEEDAGVSREAIGGGQAHVTGWGARHVCKDWVCCFLFSFFRLFLSAQWFWLLRGFWREEEDVRGLVEQS